MRKSILLAILFFPLGLTVSSQEIQLGISSGMGHYSMEDLRDFNQYVRSTQSFNPMVVSDFPSYIYIRPSLIVKMNNVGLGIAYSYHSTGSRVAASDYSGQFYFDMIVNAHSPSLHTELYIIKSGKFKIEAYSDLGVILSELKMKDFFSIGDTVYSDNAVRFKSRNYYVEPGLSLKYPLLENIEIGISFGHLLQFGKQAFYVDDKEYVLGNPSTYQPVKPDWNGVRIGLSATIILHKIPPQKIPPQNKSSL